MSQKVTSIAELKRESAAREANLPVVKMGFQDLQGFELIQRGAKLLASSTLVPKEFQGNLANCVVALNMAQRINADPLMVMQNLYVVYGRPGWSSQFLIATFNMCGRFSALRYEWTGEKGKDDWGCRAWAIENATGEKLAGALVTIDLSKKEGWYNRVDKDGKRSSKWPTMPEQMLMYRAAAWFIRAYAPEIAMGLHTVEELGDVVDAEPVGVGSYAVKFEEMKNGNGNGNGKPAAADTPATDPDPTLDDVQAALERGEDDLALELAQKLEPHLIEMVKTFIANRKEKTAAADAA